VSTDIPLPEELVAHARAFYASGAVPVPPRRAATVVLLRHPFEAYAIRRVATMAFAAGMYAFPGGSVDPRDEDPRDEAAPAALAGPSTVDWANRLGLDGSTARAVVCAAVREVFEESGVLLAGPDSSTVVGDVSGPSWEADRLALLAREVGFADLLAARGLVLRGDLLTAWSRWITPEFEPRRFDTYFFLARLPENQLTRDVGGEAEHALWGAPADLLHLPMLPPTRATLRELSGFPSIDAAMGAERDAATPVALRLPDLGEAQPNRPVM
jgi:8-oxo-dGTP pyrophosphatase MutT (NUDIX family)